MCGGPKPKPKPAQQPAAPKPKPQPKPVAAPVLESKPDAPNAEPQDTFGKKRRQGRRGTILTSSLGLTDDVQSRRKTLLGG